MTEQWKGHAVREAPFSAVGRLLPLEAPDSDQCYWLLLERHKIVRAGREEEEQLMSSACWNLSSLSRWGNRQLILQKASGSLKNY